MKRQSQSQLRTLVTLYDIVVYAGHDRGLDPCMSVTTESENWGPLFVGLFVQTLEYFSKRWMNFELNVLPPELIELILKSMHLLSILLGIGCLY